MRIWLRLPDNDVGLEVNFFVCVPTSERVHSCDNSMYLWHLFSLVLPTRWNHIVVIAPRTGSQGLRVPFGCGGCDARNVVVGEVYDQARCSICRKCRR